jgi:hypothetical protein
LTELNPAQLEVQRGLLDVGGLRPLVDLDACRELRTRFETRMQWAVDALQQAGQTLFLSKGTISTIHSCETRWRDGNAFSWQAATATGAIAHKATELLLLGRFAGYPADAVEGVLDDLVESGDSLGQFLTEATPTELATIRSGAVTATTTMIDGFPPIGRGWNARAEQNFGFNLGGSTVILSARPDLAFGRPHGPEARSLLIDFKTGRRSGAHVDDLRFYALVFTLRFGVPPWRVATFYAEDGTWSTEDIDLDVLEAAARRTGDAILKAAELNVSQRPAGLTPGMHCRWCALRETCEGAAQWNAQTDAEDDDVGFGEDELF